jgi:hypothetical protein
MLHVGVQFPPSSVLEVGTQIHELDEPRSAQQHRHEHLLHLANTHPENAESGLQLAVLHWTQQRFRFTK